MNKRNLLLILFCVVLMATLLSGCVSVKACPISAVRLPTYDAFC